MWPEFTLTIKLLWQTLFAFAFCHRFPMWYSAAELDVLLAIAVEHGDNALARRILASRPPETGNNNLAEKP